LRAVGFIDDDGAAAFGQIARMLRDEREFLEDRDDDRDPVAERIGELFGIVIDFHDDARLVLELIDGVLKQLIENEPVRDHDDAVEYLAVLRVMEAGEAVCEPRDAVTLAASGGVPDQIVLTRADVARVGDELANGIDLVVARKDEGFFFALLLDVEKSAEKVEPTVPFPDLLPEVVRPVAAGVCRVTRALVVAPIKWQEACARAFEAGGH
jgi:hypothetical protein